MPDRASTLLSSTPGTGSARIADTIGGPAPFHLHHRPGRRDRVLDVRDSHDRPGPLSGVVLAFASRLAVHVSLHVDRVQLDPDVAVEGSHPAGVEGFESSSTPSTLVLPSTCMALYPARSACTSVSW